MADHSFHSAKAVSVTIDGVQAMERGFWDGDDVVSVEHTMDKATLVEGADGPSISSASASRGATITLRLQPSSAIHALLLRRNERQQNGISTPIAFSYVDRTNGEGGSADICYIRTAPGSQVGRNATVRTWVLHTGDWKPLIPAAT